MRASFLSGRDIACVHAVKSRDRVARLPCTCVCLSVYLSVCLMGPSLSCPSATRTKPANCGSKKSKEEGRKEAGLMVVVGSCLTSCFFFFWGGGHRQFNRRKIEAWGESLNLKEVHISQIP